MGAAKESTWGTAVDATDKIPLISEDISRQYENAMHDYLQGSAGIPGLERLFEPVTGSMECYVPYTVENTSKWISADMLIAAAMGTATYGGGQGSNEIVFKDDLDVFLTLAWIKYLESGDVMEATSCYINSFTLECSADQPLKMTAEVIANLIKVQTGTTQNQYSELTALPTDVPDLILLRHFNVRFGDHSGVLASGDDTGISGFTLSVNNNLTEPTQTTPDNTSSHSTTLNTIQPVRNGFREVTLEVTIPRYDADTFFAHIASDDNLQAELYATHPSSSEEFDIIIPNMKLTNVSAPVAGPEAMEQTLTFQCLRRNSTSDVAFGDGSTDNGEMWIETDNDRSASPLA